MLKIAAKTLSFLMYFCSFPALSAQEIEFRIYRLQPIDSKGRVIDNYCVVPLYIKSRGVGFGPENTGRKYDEYRYLKWVGVKSSDEDYAKIAVIRPMHIPFVIYGEAIGPVRQLFLKRGFVPYLWNKWIDYRSIMQFVMERGDGDIVIERLLSDDLDQQFVRDLYELEPGKKVVNELSREEKKKLRDCYYLRPSATEN